MGYGAIYQFVNVMFPVRVVSEQVSEVEVMCSTVAERQCAVTSSTHYTNQNV